MNRVALGQGLSLDISEVDNVLSLALVRDVAAHCRVVGARAAAIIDEVTTAVRTWPELAVAGGISRSQQAKMSPVFRLAERCARGDPSRVNPR